MITGDFLGMSLTTDNVQPSPMPNAWRIGNLTIAGIVIGIAELLFCIVILLFGKFYLLLDVAALQTLAFIAIVFGHQASMYAVRSRKRLWSIPYPSHWVIFSSVADILIASVLAVFGLLMAPLSILIVAQALVIAFVSAFFVDMVKVPVFLYLKISE
jgi:H+-transporting ATPase